MARNVRNIAVAASHQSSVFARSSIIFARSSRSSRRSSLKRRSFSTSAEAVSLFGSSVSCFCSSSSLLDWAPTLSAWTSARLGALTAEGSSVCAVRTLTVNANANKQGNDHPPFLRISHWYFPITASLSSSRVFTLISPEMSFGNSVSRRATRLWDCLSLEAMRL